LGEPRTDEWIHAGQLKERHHLREQVKCIECAAPPFFDFNATTKAINLNGVM